MILFYLFLCFTQILLNYCSNNGPTYNIVVPQVVRPGKFNILVSMYDIKESTTVNTNLKNIMGKNYFGKETEFTPLKPTQMITLESNIEENNDNYILEIISKGEICIGEPKFCNMTYPLQYIYRDLVVLVQTDKAIYKPGQDVQFRVMVFNENLIPMDKKDIMDMKILIIDPLQLKLKEISFSKEISPNYNMNFSSGITGDMVFKLHEQAREGDWTIRVETNGLIEEYMFRVENYVLPMANITLNLPKFIKYSPSTTFDYKIYFFYIFGKPVTGEFKMSVQIISPIETQLKIVDSKKIINGSANGMINLSDLHIIPNNFDELKINVSIIGQDLITKSVYKTFEIIYVIKSEYKAQLEDNRGSFRPGKSLTKIVKVTNHQGDLITEKILNQLTCSANIKSINQNLNSISPKKIYKKEGKLFCEFNTETDYRSMDFQVSMRDMLIFNRTSTFSHNCLDDYIQIELQEESIVPIVDNNIKLSISSNVDFNRFDIFVISQGIITEHIPISSKTLRKNFVIDVMFKKEMIPQSIIAVYMKIPGKSLTVSDAFLLKSDDIFNNFVNLTTKNKSVTANQEVNFNVNTNEDSVLFFLGVDEAVLNLKSGNDISENRIMDQIMSKKFDFEDGNDVFSQIRMTLSTKNERECSTIYEIHKHDNNDLNQLRLRKNFMETWIWDRMRTHESQTDIYSNVPDSITTYSVTAFSLHKEFGLGITKAPVKIQVFKNLFIKLNLPFSIKRNETTEIHLVAFNYFNLDLEVEINVRTNNTKDSKYIKIINCNQNFKIEANGVYSMTCKVQSQIVGQIPIVAEITTIMNEKKIYDDEIRDLNIKFEGHLVTQTKTVYFDLTNENENKKFIYQNKFEFPGDSIKGSKLIFISGSTELITQLWDDRVDKYIETIKNRQHKIEPPGGCCQQSVAINFPKLFWLEYVNLTKKFSICDYDIAIKNVEYIIANLCFHQNNTKWDGSFTFYNSYDKSFVWQTALSLKMMIYAKNFIKIDNTFIPMTTQWLNSIRTNGKFIETDSDHVTNIYTNINKALYKKTDVYLTAFVQTLLNKNEETLNYLRTTFNDLDDPLDILSTCYALNYFNSDYKDECYNKVQEISTLENDSLYWKRANKEDYHVTAYRLMLLTTRGMLKEALKVFNYLTSKQDNNGLLTGQSYYENSYLNMICVEALSQFIRTLPKFNLDFENIDLEIITPNGTVSKMEFKQGTQTTQIVELDSKTNSAIINLDGSGRIKINFMIQYYTNKEINGQFSMTSSETKKGQNVILTLCSRYRGLKSVNNVIIEFDLPSGYQYTGDQPKNDVIDKIESKFDGTHINVYLKKVDSNELCIDIPAIISFNVENQLPTPIKIYPYYDRSALKVHSHQRE